MSVRCLLGLFLAAIASTAAGADTSGSIDLTVETRSVRGKYAPRHVMAIWVTDHQGRFVKTLIVKARTRTRYLSRWMNSSRGNDVDANTWATLRDHGVVAATWDCRDAEGRLVPDGEYQIHVEFTETNGVGPSTPQNYLLFKKGKDPVALSPRKLPGFEKVTLKYKPLLNESARQP